MKSKMTKLMVAIGALSLAGGAMAATETANLTVTATVENACAIGPGTLAFGTIALDVQADGTLGTAVVNGDTAATQMSIICTKDASATITAGNGANFSTIRKMATGANRLGYRLYTDSGRGTELSGSTGISYTGTGLATTTTTIYGQIIQDDLKLAPKGDYTDTVVMTITYSL